MLLMDFPMDGDISRLFIPKHVCISGITSYAVTADSAYLSVMPRSSQNASVRFCASS